MQGPLKMASMIIKDSFEINIKIMRIFGLYPPKTKKCLYKLYAYFLHLFLITPVPVLGGLYLVVTEDIDLVQVADNAFLLAELGCYIVKFLPFINNGDRIKRCIHCFEATFFTNVNNEQYEIIDNCIKTCRRNTTIYMLVVGGAVSSWAMKPFFWGNYRLPVDIWLPFDVSADVRTYYIVYFYVFIAVGYDAFCSGVTNPLIAGLAYHATSQLQILKHNLQNLNKYSNEKDMYVAIKQCINHHDAVLSFVKEYEKCFSLVVFSQFVGSVLVFCISCLQLLFIEPFSINFFSLMFYLGATLGEIFLYCYYGTTLYEESDTLTNAIYQSEWYQYDEKCKQALMILMERAQKPMVVRAGTIVDISLVTFSNILKKSYSLFAVLQNYK